MLVKSRSDQRWLKQSGRLIGKILEDLAALCRPGISTLTLDQAAETMIRMAGGRPAFKGYHVHGVTKPFPATLCTSLNAELVHGIPRVERILKSGDLVSLDIGMEWPAAEEKSPGSSSRGVSGTRKSKKIPSKGVFTDTAVTFTIGGMSKKIEKLLAVTKQALEAGIAAALPGSSVADIGRAIETYVKSRGNYGIVRALVGHGVGHAVHEEPHVPNYYDPSLESVILKPGMVIAIEPMISLGSHKVQTLSDGWTIAMADQALCAHFEHTVIITERGNVVVTRRPEETSYKK